MHVPHWLPEGFGLVATVSGGGGQVWGIWEDEDCRMVTVYYSPGRIEPTPGPHVGPWTVTVDVAKGCGNAVLGTGRCLDYQANASNGSLGIQAIGIERSIGDRIARSIPP